MPAGPGRKEQRSIRMIAEDVNGTPKSPRYIWRGPGDTLDDTRTVVSVEEMTGVFSGSDRTYIPKLEGKLNLASTDATFEQLGDIFTMLGIGTAVGGRAGTAQGANGSAVIQQFPIPTTTYQTYTSYTIEAGDNSEAEVMEYTLADDASLEFAGGDAMKVSASLTGRQVQRTNDAGTFSAVGTLPTVETILAGRGTFYLSPSTSTFGAGVVTAGNILAGKLDIATRWSRKYSVDGGILTFGTAVFTGIDISGEITMEHQNSGTFGASGTGGQKDKWRNQQPQLLRMQWTGGTISSGTTYQAKTLIIDLPIKFQKFAPLSDMDGNDITVATFMSKYNADNAATGRGTITVVRIGTSEMAGA